MKTISLLLACLLSLSVSILNAKEPLRHFEVYEVPDAGLIVYKPGSPAWNMEVDERRSNDAVILSTPNNYYPPASIEIRLDQRFSPDSADLPEIAKTLNQTLRDKTGADTTVSIDFNAKDYGTIPGLQNQFDINFNGDPYTVRHTVGLMPSGHITTLLHTSPQGMVEDHRA